MLRLLLSILIFILSIYRCNSAYAANPQLQLCTRKLRDANGKITLKCGGGGGGGGGPAPTPVAEPVAEPVAPVPPPVAPVPQPVAPVPPPVAPVPAPTPPLCSPGYDYNNNCAPCGKFY